MINGIILNNDGSQLTDDCGDEIRLVISSGGELVIQHNLDDGRARQIVLDEDVVELLRNRLNN